MSDDLHDIEALRRGDEDAWEAAFDAVWDDAIRATRYWELGLTEEDAQDAFMVAIEEIPRRLDSVNSLGDFARGVTSLSRERTIDEFRKRLTVKRGAGLVQSLEDLPDGSEGPFDVHAVHDAHTRGLESEERDRLIEKFFTYLNDDLTRCLLLEGVRGVTAEESGRIHGLAPGAVRSRRSRGLSKLCECLKKHPELRQHR